MKVYLKAAFVVGQGKNLTRYRKSNGRHDLRDLPDDLLALLPKSAQVVEGPKVASAEPAELDNAPAAPVSANPPEVDPQAEFKRQLEELQASQPAAVEDASIVAHAAHSGSGRRRK